MRVHRLWPLLAFFAGCQCTPFGLEQTRFTCTTQADCVEGFECRDQGAGLECLAVGTVIDAGRGDAGEQDGGLDAGEVDAGETDAGELDAGETDAGVDAGFDAGMDAGIDAGVDGGPSRVPTLLRFATAPQTVSTNACSQVINVETLAADGGVTPVLAATTVTVFSLSGGVTFFTASNCSGTQTNNVIIGASQSSTSFYAIASDAGTYALAATSPMLMTAGQPFTALAPPTSLVFTSTPPNPVRGGTCLTATLEARRTGVATPVSSNTSIGLTVAPTGGARFYSDGTCTTSTTTATMLAGTSTATFFVKPLTAGTNTITAAAPFGSANQAITTTPIVRRGQCDFVARVGLSDGGAATDLNRTCSFSPPVTDINASMLITQATAVVSGTELGVGEVRCRLFSSSTINCFRREDLDPASVHFQIAEVPQGMLVQRSSATNCPALITLTTPVNLTRSFVLKSAANSTINFDDEDAIIATLTSPTTVAVDPTSCQGYEVQVVDWAGLTVTRGTVDGGVPTGAATVSATGLPAASNNRAVLIQPGIGANMAPVCGSMIRATLPSPSSIVFTRGAGETTTCVSAAPEALAWERIDFGNKAVVREFSATLAPGALSTTVAMPVVDTSRTIVFSGSQIAGGQGAGETDHPGGAHYTEAAFQLVLTNSTTVTVTRPEATATAIVTFYVAELLP